MLRILFASMCLSLAAGCGPAGGAPPSATAAVAAMPSPASSQATVPPQLALTPGLVFSGYVRLSDGTGLANVTICRNFASYPGDAIATTDYSGHYQAVFAFIPGDEMIGVWPIAAGYTFSPQNYRWRHYYGAEGRSLDFLAAPGPATSVPPAPCS